MQYDIMRYFICNLKHFKTRYSIVLKYNNLILSNLISSIQNASLYIASLYSNDIFLIKSLLLPSI